MPDSTAAPPSDWQPESHAERLRRQAREMDLAARLAWLEEITTLALQLRQSTSESNQGVG